MIRNFKISSCKINVNLDYVHKMKDWNKPHQRGIIHPTTIYGCCHQLVARERGSNSAWMAKQQVGKLRPVSNAE